MATAAIPTSPAERRSDYEALRSRASQRAADVERRVIRGVFQPPPRVTVDEWADAYRYLSPESSAEPGKYNTSRAPYQREPLRALSDPMVREVVLMWPSQVGKTEILNNFIGHRIHLSPGPMLVLQPTLQMAEAWSKDRLAPMLRDTPVLRGKVKDARSRDADNTLLHKRFPGGHITVAGANSPAGLASRPIRDVLTDEVDRYPVSAGTEGDPIGLADRRASTFRNGKRLRISSPTIKGQSRIESEFIDSTQEKWQVPCPECNEYQILVWGGRDTLHGLRWDPDRPETVYYACLHCGAVIDEMHKGWMNERGKWVAENPGHVSTRGFWMNALVSPWVPWQDLVREFLAVKHDAVRLRQFVNTVLCETWEDAGERVEAHVLADRFEAYPDGVQVPMGAAVLIRTVDVQGDRLETAVWGFGDREEAWPIEHEIIPGDPGTPEPWTALDGMLRRTYRHESGLELTPKITGIDSGGHHAKEVYAFCRQRVAQRVYALKGSSIEGSPLLGKPTRNNAAKTILYLIGVFTGKESAMSRLAKIREPGPGYIHIPDWLDGEHLAQLTAEKLITRIVGGRAKRVWIKARDRNEFLDLFVYALAMLQVLGTTTVRNLGKLAKQLEADGQALVKVEASPDAETEQAESSKKRPRRRGSWMKGIR